MVRAAIIGLGVQGRKYAQIIYSGAVPNLSLVSVTARSEESVKWAEENIKGVKIYPDYDSLFENYVEFDAVIITTPHKLHPEIAMLAFDKNKAVLCEKPSGVNIKEVEKMNKLSKGIPFAMMFNNRIQPLYKWIMDTISNGTVGEIRRAYFKCTKFFRTQFYHNSSGWRSTWEGEGGGALINQGQHPLDLWQWFFGMPDKVIANMGYGKYNPFDVDDEATLLMKYKDMSGVFIISTGEPMSKDVIEIVGTEGRILVEDNDVSLWTYENVYDYINKARVTNDSAIKGSVEKLYFAPLQDPYTPMLQNFADYVEGSAAPICRGVDGINALKLAQMAYKY